MTMLKTFDLKGNKLSFADWISNLSPCETPFVSMVGKEKIDQTQYSWQTDRLAQPNMQASVAKEPWKGIDPDTADITLGAAYNKEGASMVSENRFHTKVHTNFTQIFRKVVRVSDTTKKVSLYGRNSELTYQMEKAGMEIKRDLEHAILNSVLKGRLGTATTAGAFDGFQNLVAPFEAKCWDTGAIVNKSVKFTWSKDVPRTIFFTKEQVFDLTYNLYLAGSRANKIMFHPMHMSVFSDWIGSTDARAKVAKPHLHRMFDGLDTKYNALVNKIRDPLGQEFTLIPNRHMPVDKLFFFNENDWSQMVLREPVKTTLAKMGSSEKQMIEFEVGLRHRNPFASGILSFIEDGKHVLDIQVINPQNLLGDNTAETTVVALIRQSDGKPGPAGSTHPVKITVTDEEGGDVATFSTLNPAAMGEAEGFVKGSVGVTHKIKTKDGAAKSGRFRVAAHVAAETTILGTDTAIIDAYQSRDK